jgi:quinol-cytochrome oxidoreductase complex cytochrome b subunit
MMMLILGIEIIVIIILNLYITHTMTAEQMKNDFITEKGTFGMIITNMFYALAWALKGIKKFVK